MSHDTDSSSLFNTFDFVYTSGELDYPLTKSIVLIGMMGVGKSTIGRRLAKRLELEFHDSDQKIEEQAYLPIEDIFEINGERYFRELEKKIVKELLEDGPYVIATGGGTFMDDELQKMINDQAISIWLDAPLEVLVERVSRRNNRPLLKKGDPETIIKRLLDERNPQYAKCHIKIESNQGQHSVVVDHIIDALNKHLGTPPEH